jgi:hypothetical protein
MPYREPETVAVLIATLLRRSGKTRGRMSEKTLKLIARRRNLRGAFEAQLVDWLNYYDVWLIPLDRGGWALLAKSALEGAPPLKAADHLKDELQALSLGSSDPTQDLVRELGFDGEETEE